MSESPLRVLVIEDNPGDVTFLRLTLERDTFTRYSITAAERLQEGIQKVRQHTFDVILLDLGLPDSQGLDTFKQMRQASGEIPTVVLSGLMDEEVALHAVKAGAQDYVVKGTAGWDTIARAIRHGIERHTLNKSLQESEQRFSRIFHASPVAQAISVLENGKILDANDAYCALMDYTWDELVDHNALELGIWAAPEDRNTLVRQLKLRSWVQNQETKFRTRSGRIITSLTSFEQIEMNGEKCIISTFLDITERKQAEEALRESEERFRTFIEQSTDGLTIADEQGVVIEWNQALSQLNGLARERALGMNMWDVQFMMIPPEKQATFDIARLKTNLTEMLKSGQSPFFEKMHEIEIRTVSGERKFIQQTSYPICTAKGFRIGAIIRDITEGKRAEKKLQESEEQYRYLFENNPHPMWAYDLDTLKFLAVNDAAVEKYGYSRDEFLGMTIADIRPREDLGRLYDHLAQARPALQYSSGWQHTLKDGRLIDVEISSHTIELAGQRAALLVALDVTERKQAEEALRESESHAQAMLQAIPDMMFRMNREGVFLDYRADTHDLYAQSEPSLIGKRNRDITPPEFANLIDHTIQITLETGTLQTLEYQLPIINRGVRDYEARMTVSGPDEVITIVRDITENKRAERALRESEEKYRGLMESLDSVVATVDKQGHFLYLNGVAAQQLGGVPGDFIGRTMHELFPEPVASAQLADIQKVIEDDKGMVFENTSWVQGKPRWYHTTIQPIHDEDSRVIQVLVNSTDIHDLKTTQQELQELNRTLEERVKQRTAEVQDLYDNAPTGYHSLDTHGRFIQINQTELSWLGYSREEVLGRSITEFFTEDSLAIFKGTFPKFKQSGSLHDLELDFVHKDGSILPTLVNAVAIFDGQGHYVMSRSTVFDNTERKRTDEALRQNEETYRALFENANDAIFLLHPEGAILRVNARGADLLGYRIDELIDRKDIDLIVPTEIDDARQRTHRLLKGERLPVHERRLIKKDGAQIETEINLSLISDAMGQPKLVQSLVRDISTRKRAEETLRLANIELERALRMKDEFLATMSHELRTPLNSILGLSESMLEETAGPVNEKQQKYLGIMSESGRHLLELINDILDLAKVDSGQIKLEMGNVNIQNLCESSLRMVKQLAIRKQQSIELNVERGVGQIWADERRLKQMIVNLLSNAVKFTRNNGRLGLDVTADRLNARLLIEVWDMGIGIREQDLTRLFQPFVQLDSSLSRESAGTGLGLALVAQMARLHGGSVGVVSQLEKGSRFTLTLPWDPAQSVEAADTFPRPGKFPAFPSIEPDGQRTILLVEDTDSAVMLIKDYLEATGYRVEVARNGAEGIARAKSLHPDLILMDVQMPGMDGLEATQRIRQEVTLQQTPILALTALAMNSDRERCIAAGMNDYISKPVKLKELVNVIQNYLIDPGTAKTE